MNPTMDLDYNDVAVFTAVVRARGFTAAGRQLGLPASAVSRRVKRLEQRLGYALLERTTRSVGLTEAGRIFYDRTASISEVVEEARRAVAETREAMAGVVRVTMPPDHRGILWCMLRPFLEGHPDVDLEIVHTLDKLDLVSSDIDVALRGGPAPDSTSYSATQLFDSRILLAASPDYLSARGIPQRVEDLADHDGVCLDRWVPNAIHRLDGSTAPIKVEMRNRIRSNSLDTAQRAALDGLGIAPLLQLTCQEELDRGELIEVLNGALPMSAPMWVLARTGRRRTAAARALVEHLLSEAAALQSTSTR